MASYTDSKTTNKQQTNQIKTQQGTINKCYNYNDKTGKGKDVPAEALKAYEGLGGTALLILNLRSRWISVARFVP
jgi:hypothetical protein